MANSVHPVIWLAVLVTLLVDTSDASWPIYRLCWYDGRFHKPGSVFPAIDGCNTCTCTTLGTVVCTKKACIPAPVCPTPIGGGICVEQCSRDEDCFAGQKCCSNGCGHVCTTIQNCAAIQCDVPKCDFPTGAVASPPAGWCCPGCGCRIGGGKVVRIGESYKIGCN